MPRDGAQGSALLRYKSRHAAVVTVIYFGQFSVLFLTDTTGNAFLSLAALIASRLVLFFICLTVITPAVK